MKKTMTVGELAIELNEPLHRIQYVIQSRNIEPALRVGGYRVYTQDQLSFIREALTGVRVHTPSIQC